MTTFEPKTLLLQDYCTLHCTNLCVQATLWRAEGKNQGWLGGSVPPDPAKMASRIKEKESSVQRCAQLGSGARLKDNVHTIDSEAGSTVAVLLHPFRPLLTSVDGVGTLRVHNYRHSNVINCFHISGAASAHDFLLLYFFFTFEGCVLHDSFYHEGFAMCNWDLIC